MGRSETYKMSKQDKRAVDLFAELGMPKNLAKTLLYVSQVEECRSVDIEHETKLRQPEVSIAMQQLMKNGWISKRTLKKKGKGRPIHIYKLDATIQKIMKSFETKKMQELNTIKKDLTELKSLIESR